MSVAVDGKGLGRVFFAAPPRVLTCLPVPALSRPQQQELDSFSTEAPLYVKCSLLFAYGLPSIAVHASWFGLVWFDLILM